MREDLDVVKRALEEAHGGLHRFASESEIDEAFAAARRAVERPMPRLAFAARLEETLAVVRDGHLRLEYDAATAAALSTARLLPLRVAHEGGRLIVTHNDAAADNTILPGMELRSINQRPIDEVVTMILPKLPGDGFIETGKARQLARGLARHYWLFVDQASSFLVTARADAGGIVSARLEGVANAERGTSVNPVNATVAANLAALDGPREAVSMSFPQDGVGLLRVRYFDGENFPASVAAAFRELREKNARALILDLRGNGGGVDMYGALIVSHLVPTPFRYFDRIEVTTVRPSFATWKASTFENLKNGTAPGPDGRFLVQPVLHPGVAEQQPAAAPFLGRLIVLIDGGTFSTAADLAAQVRSRTKATFIGEETGGTAEGNTSGLNAQIVLPRSGLKLKIHMYGYWNAVAGAKPGRGTLPDIGAVRTVADVLAGQDPVLERAVALAGR